MANHQRDPGKEQFWRQALTRFHRSGLTIRAFCVRHRLSEPSFYAWRAELARRDRAAQIAVGQTPCRRPSRKRRPAPRAFVPVRIVPDTEVPAADGGIDILCRGGRVIRVRAGFDRTSLQEALTVLEALPC
jgi:hypothetical protein